MENFAKRAAALLATALVAGALTGCVGQTATSGSAASESASASASAQASAETATETEGGESDAASANAPDEVVAALQAALKGAPAYKSVTLTEQRTVETFVDPTGDESDDETTYDEDTDTSASASSAAAQNQNIIESTRIAKFDASGSTAKTSSSASFLGNTIKEYVTGDKVVVAFDGETYGGTVEEMSAQELTNVDAFLNARIGDMDVLATCLADATISDENGNTRYDLKVSPTTFAQTDKTFVELANIGYLLNDMSESFLFDADGRLLEVSVLQDTNFDVTNATISFSNYDATTVETAPKATKTYADMTADVKAALEKVNANDESTNDEATDGEGSYDETAGDEETN